LVAVDGAAGHATTLLALLWIPVWLAWSLATRSFHPTWALDLIATGCMVVAFATAVAVHHRMLLPHLWRKRNYVLHVAALALTLAATTGCSLLLIRLFYVKLLGPYPVNSWSVDFGLDYVGGVVHVAAAEGFLLLVQRFRGNANALHGKSDSPVI
jgi:hypothetical protein